MLPAEMEVLVIVLLASAHFSASLSCSSIAQKSAAHAPAESMCYLSLASSTRSNGHEVHSEALAVYFTMPYGKLSDV